MFANALRPRYVKNSTFAMFGKNSTFAAAPAQRIRFGHGLEESEEMLASGCGFPVAVTGVRRFGCFLLTTCRYSRNLVLNLFLVDY